jgi:putative flippase GtrA
VKGSKQTNTNRITKELLMASRFTLVGIAAASIHIGFLWILITQFDVDPIRANVGAFLTAFSFSFIGQYVWTFRSSLYWPTALVRFFAISLVAFTLNNIALLGLLNLEQVHSSFAAVLAACIIPLVSYVFGRAWAFR